MIKEIARYLYSVNRKNYIIHCIMLLCGLVVMGILATNVSTFYNEQKQSVDKLDANKEYQLSNTIEELSNFTEYFAEDDHLENLKMFYETLNNDDRFIYLDKFDQCLYMQNNLLTEIFAVGYEDGSPEYYEDDDGVIKYAIKNVTLSKKCQDYYDFKVSEGRIFDNSDFIDNSKIHVILGSKYKDFYKIGDMFTGEYLNQERKYEVIGFLEENTAITVQGDVIFLDRYVISPSVILNSSPQTEDELFYQAASYVEKIEGHVVLTNDYDIADFTAYIEELTNKYSMFDILIVDSNASMRNIALIMSCYMGKNMLFLLIACVFFMLTLINLCFLNNLANKISHYCGVQILNGCKYMYIFKAIIICEFVCILLGECGAIFILTLIYSRMFIASVLIIFVIYLVLNIMICAILFKKLLSENIEYMLRRA